jgi:hypothetical protein
LSKPFFTIVAYHLRKFARRRPREECRGRLAARGIHPHVERTVGTEREAARRIVDLRRGNAEVEERAVDALDAARRERLRKLGEPAASN